VRTPDLETLGWSPAWAAHFEAFAAEGLVPARVALEHQHIYRVYTGHDEPLAQVAGRFRHRAGTRQEYPAVGDWVGLERAHGHTRATIHAVLPRTSRFSRKSAGDVTEEQVVAANIDLVFLVSGLDRDFNIRRIERYLVTAREGGARPVVVLNKSDLCEDLAWVLEQVGRVAAGAPVHAISSLKHEGLDTIAPYLVRGQTIALLGSSGVGKSTLINALLGQERQRTRAVRERDSRGRHTTTHRELVVLPQGGLLIDTPGMRELQLWESEAALEEAFEDIDALSAGCFFRDCQHETEPRCAVKAAVEGGQLPPDRLANFHRLRREAKHLEAKVDERAASEEKRKGKVLSRNIRRVTSTRLKP
jgi:ribosome biogenesis GTPase